MKKNINVALTLSLCLLLSSCNTITFVQYEQPGKHKTTNRWHHSTISGMVEISRPLDVRSICGNKAWTKITTEHTFYNLVPSVLIPSVSVFALYSAWTNKVQCHEPVTDNTINDSSTTEPS